MAGYSRLIGADEEGTHQTVANYLDAIAGIVSGHDGCVVHYAGDAVLADFASVVAAVKCAVAVQNDLAKRNVDIPEDRKVQFRIGVNLGDVIVDRDDIYGNGVNVAARLESLADPGGVCVSGKVLDEVQGKVDVGFEDMGPQEVKNIADPVRAYRLLLNSPVAATMPRREKPSIAVLPFDNLSGDPEQQYFADGMAEDIITGLSRFHSINVIARNSTFSYKGKSPDVRKVAQNLGARYVLEGSVRRSGNRIRITGQLIDAGTGNHLWAQRYDRDLDDIFAVQDEITMAIIAAIEPAIGYREREGVRQNRPESVDAWGLYQQGLSHYYHGTSAADLKHALASFEASVKADPGFAAAHAMCAEAMVRLLIHSVSEERESMLQNALATARTALLLDPDDATAHVALGWVNVMLNDFDGALVVSNKALELNPFSASAYDIRGYAFQALGDDEKALESLRSAERLSLNHPYSGGIFSRQAISLVSLGRYEEAVQAAHRAMQGPNRGIYAAAMGAVALKELGQEAQAKAMVQELLKRAPKFSVDDFRVMFSHHRNVEALARLLLNAGVPK